MLDIQLIWFYYTISLAYPSGKVGGLLLVQLNSYLPLRRLQEGEGVVSTLWSCVKDSQQGANPLEGTLMKQRFYTVFFVIYFLWFRGRGREKYPVLCWNC